LLTVEAVIGSAWHCNCDYPGQRFDSHRFGESLPCVVALLSSGP